MNKISGDGEFLEKILEGRMGGMCARIWIYTEDFVTSKRLWAIHFMDSTILSSRMKGTMVI